MLRFKLAIILLFCVNAAAAGVTDHGADLTYLFEGTRAALRGEWQAPGELIALANELVDRELDCLVETPDGRIAERAFHGAGARLSAAIEEFEARLSAGRQSAAEEQYREELLPIFLDLAVSWRVIEEQKRQSPKAR